MEEENNQIELENYEYSRNRKREILKHLGHVIAVCVIVGIIVAIVLLKPKDVDKCDPIPVNYEPPTFLWNPKDLACFKYFILHFTHFLK